ncbi:MAG: hypothetical protein ACRCUT_13040, partial [Spirochaetota bacterium]
METVDIWYFTDNDAGKSAASSLDEIGLTLHTVSGALFDIPPFKQSGVNLFIFDILSVPYSQLLDKIRGDARLQKVQKVIVLPFSDVESAAGNSRDILHLDFLSRPYNKREFILFLEKTAVVEKYREIMRSISQEAEGRIEAFESLMRVRKGDILETGEEKEVFDKIITFEKSLLDEQKKLNDAIRDFASVRK